MTKQHITVVIPTFNRKSYLAQTIRDLMAQEDIVFDDSVMQESPPSNWHMLWETPAVWPAPRVSIVVVDDGCTDGTSEMLRDEFPQVHVVRGEGDWWYTRSMNEGFELAYSLEPNYVLTMNDDVRLPADYIHNIYTAIKEAKGVCIMGSISVTESSPERITFSGVKDINWWRFKYTHHMPHYSEIDTMKVSGTKESKVLPGRGMLIPTALLKSLNGFDPDLIQYGSDDDFCLRAATNGARVMVSYDAVVRSYDTLTGVGNPSRKDSLMDVVKGFSNKYSTLYLPKTIRAIRRHGNRLLLPLTLAIVVVGSIRANLKYRQT